MKLIQSVRAGRAALLGGAALVLGLSANGPLAAEAAPVAKLGAPVPETATSRIYGPVVLPGTPAAAELAAAGYEQREYFLSGHANVYGYAAGELKIERAAVPYTTRIVVLAPTDPRRFSGTVQLATFHPQLSQNQWGRFNTYVLRHGDAYVAVSIGADEQQRKASTPQAPMAAPLIFKWFDPERYAPIDWPRDDGVRWDVFAQTAALIKAGGPRGPLPALKVERVYASGWSFLGSFLRTFINEGFHDRLRTASGAAVIDGYLIGISTSGQAGGYLPINSESPAAPVGDPRRRLRTIDVPVIEMLSENEGQANTEPAGGDRDAKPGQHRVYELAGVSHQDLGYAPDAYPGSVQLAARGHPGAAPAPACAYELSDVPMRDVAQAALANLDVWVRTGVAPPPSSRLELAALRQPVKDAVGNTKGGVRAAQLEVPLARYGAPPDGACATRWFLPMRRLPLSSEELRQLYPGGRAEYLSRFRRQLDRLVAERRLLREDADAEFIRAESYAAQAFAQRAQRASRPDDASALIGSQH